MAAPAQSTGFVNLNRYLDANQGAIQNEANTLANNDTQAATSAMGASLTPADYVSSHQNAQNASNNLSGLTNSGSLQDQIQKTYGGGAGQNSFDTNLLVNSPQAQKTFFDAQRGLTGLNDYLSKGPQQGEDPQGYVGTPASLAPVTAIPAPEKPPPQPAAPTTPPNNSPWTKNGTQLPGQPGGNAGSLQYLPSKNWWSS